MTEPCASAIHEAVRQAAASGEILYVAATARRIARSCGGPGDLIAKALTEAAIRAGVTLQFGTPEQA